MKINKLLYVFATILLLGCDDNYIDDISSVDPRPDEAAPTVAINYPLEGTAVRVVDEVAPITISFQATDDIELETIAVQLDGQEIATYNEFIDYRSFTVDDLVYKELTNGEHTLTVEVSDIAGKITTQTVTFEKLEPYQPMEDEIFYLPFDGEYVNLVNLTSGTKIGSPLFDIDDMVAGISSYKGAEGAYVTFPSSNLATPEISASFWMKINPEPDRAGILVIAPEDPENPNAPMNGNSGFRFFREIEGGTHRFKLSVGTGGQFTWFDGKEAAGIAPENLDVWHHFAFTISRSEATVYIDGEVVSSGTFNGIDWSGTDILSIMSGAPRFTGWSHMSDESLMDELRIFDKALTQEEVQTLMAAEKPE